MNYDIKEEDVVTAIEILTIEYGAPPTITNIAKFIYPDVPLHSDKDGLTVPYYSKVRYIIHKLQDKGTHRVDSTRKGSFVYIVTEQVPEITPKEEVVDYENIIEYGKKKNNPKVTNFCEAIAKENNSPDLKRGSKECLWFLLHAGEVLRGERNPHPAKIRYCTVLKYYEILFPEKPSPKDVTDSEISTMIKERRYENLVTGNVSSHALRSYLLKVRNFMDVMKRHDMITHNPLLYHTGFNVILNRLDINGPFVPITVLGHDKK